MSDVSSKVKKIVADHLGVEEEKVKELLFGQSETDVSRELTHLILERELLKVASRHIYAKQIKKD